MILDHLSNSALYERLHPAFAKAFEFLRNPASAALPAGRHEIDGERLFAMVSRGDGRGKDPSPLEAHRRYIDIQFSVQADVIGWRPTKDCRGDGKGFDVPKDIEFFADKPWTWLDVPAGCFAIFYPADAHAPMAATGPIHKIIVKIEV